MCNEEVFIFFSAAWFLLPLVMLLAFYKHFFPPFRSSNFAPAMAFQRYRVNVNLQHRLLHVPDTHCVDKEGGLKRAELVRGGNFKCQKIFIIFGILTGF